MKSILLLTLFFHSLAWSKNCGVRLDSLTSDVQSLNRIIATASTQTFECAEQEIVDVLVDPIRLQNFAMKQCETKLECKSALVKEAARVSKLDELRFKELNAVALWVEIQKFSGLNRIAPISYADLPLAEDLQVLFEKIKAERIASRTLSQSENLTIACTALAAIVGPAKFKAFKVAKSFVHKTYVIERTHDVEKLLAKSKLPPNVKDKFLQWSKDVQEKGLTEVKKTPGYHDEPLASPVGRRSVRMNQGYRVFYETVEEAGIVKIKIIDINLHKY